MDRSGDGNRTECQHYTDGADKGLELPRENVNLKNEKRTRGALILKRWPEKWAAEKARKSEPERKRKTRIA